MEKTTELLKRLVVNHRRDGQSIYDPEAKRELIPACLQPGVSIARLAMAHQVNANLLRTWVARYQREHNGNANEPKTEAQRELANAFMPIQIETTIDGHLSSETLTGSETTGNANAGSSLPSVIPTQRAKADLFIRLHVQLPNGVRFDISEVNRIRCCRLWKC